MRRTAPLALVMFGLVAPVALAQTQERAGLRVALKSGDQLGYTYTWTLEQKTELPGMPIPPQTQTSEVCYHLDQRVESVKDGVATVLATVSSIKVRLGAGMMGEMTYDSATDDESNPFAWLRHVVGKTITFKMKTTGEVTELTGGDAIRQEVTAALERESAANPGGGGGDEGGMMGMDPSMMMQMIAARLMVVFTDPSLKSSLEAVNHVLPDSGVAAEGATWSHPVVETLPNVGTLRFTGEFANRGSARDAVRITTRASDEVQLEREVGDASADPMMDELTDGLAVTRKTVNGTSSFDVARGRLLDSELVHEILMEGPLPARMALMLGDQAKNAKLKQTILLTLRYVLDETAPAPATPGPGGKPSGSF